MYMYMKHIPFPKSLPIPHSTAPARSQRAGAGRRCPPLRPSGSPAPRHDCTSGERGPGRSLG